VLSSYDLFTPSQIVFGWGRRSEAGDLGRKLGKRGFLVCGSRRLQSSGIVDEVATSFQQTGVELVRLAEISGEPTVDDVDRTTALLERHSAGTGEFVLALGGGSAIDLAKAVAAMATNRQSRTVKDYLEGVGSGLAIKHPPLPVIAMPTTAGTGSEATKNAVISSREPAFKKSLRADLMVPRIVLIDPELTVSVPPQITAYTGMDAITQLIESYISCKAKPIPQALALQGLKLALPAIRAAYADGTLRWSREAMSHAALLSGIALANSGLGMAHGIAAALGIQSNVPHGLACAVMLPATLRTNRIAAERQLVELAEACGIVASDRSQAAAALIDTITQVCVDLSIPQRLSELGVKAEKIPALVQASRGNSMNGNPRSISDAELTAILEEML